MEVLKRPPEVLPPHLTLLAEKAFYVPGRGNMRSPKLMLVGEAPGRLENARRKPFVGPAGEKLAELLVDNGIIEDDVYITNVVKWWPRDSKGRTRAPTDAEVSEALPLLKLEIQSVQPTYIGLMGRVAIRTFFPKTGHVHQVNGKILGIPKSDLKLVPLYHPAAALYPQSARQTEQMNAGYAKLGELYHESRLD